MWAALAQPVEQRIRNAWVGCSSHPGGTNKIILRTGLTGDHEILMGLQLLILCQLQDVATIQSWVAGKINVFDARVRKA